MDDISWSLELWPVAQKILITRMGGIDLTYKLNFNLKEDLMRNTVETMQHFQLHMWFSFLNRNSYSSFLKHQWQNLY